MTKKQCSIPKNKFILYTSIGMFVVLYTGVFIYWRQKYLLT